MQYVVSKFLYVENNRFIYLKQDEKDKHIWLDLKKKRQNKALNNVNTISSNLVTQFLFFLSLKKGSIKKANILKT